MKFILQKVNLPVIVEKKVIKFEFATHLLKDNPKIAGKFKS